MSGASICAPPTWPRRRSFDPVAPSPRLIPEGEHRTPSPAGATFFRGAHAKGLQVATTRKLAATATFAIQLPFRGWPVDPQTVRSRPMTDISSPETLWAGALWYWAARGGDLSRCVGLLRDGVPIPQDCARAFADILEGKIAPRSALGGPSPESQLRTLHRDLQVRMFFDLFLYEGQKRVRTRDDAARRQMH